MSKFEKFATKVASAAITTAAISMAIREANRRSKEKVVTEVK